MSVKAPSVDGNDMKGDKEKQILLIKDLTLPYQIAVIFFSLAILLLSLPLAAPLMLAIAKFILRFFF